MGKFECRLDIIFRSWNYHYFLKNDIGIVFIWKNVFNFGYRVEYLGGNVTMFTTFKWHGKVHMMVRTHRDEAMMLKSSPSLGLHGGIQCGQTINKYKSSKFQPEKMKAFGEIVVEQ